MLEELIIKNLALIRDCHIQFSPGLNLVTGETGAGKTILVSAINLIAGARASSECVGSNGHECLVEARFTLPDSRQIQQALIQYGVSIEEEMLIKRIVNKEGRSKAYINNSMTTIQTLSLIGQMLISISGQFENQRLLKPEYHMTILDEFGEITEERIQLNTIIDEYAQMLNELHKINEQIAEKSKRKEFMEFALKEINEADLRVDEEKELREEKERLKHANEIKSTLREVSKIIYVDPGSINGSMNHIIKLMAKIQAYEQGVSRLLEALESIKNQFQDIFWDIKKLDSMIEVDPIRLERCMERLELIGRLKKKYGGSIEEVLRYKEELVSEHIAMEELQNRLKAIRLLLEEKERECMRKAEEISHRRRKVSRDLEDAIRNQLRGMNMPHTSFKVELRRKPVPSGSGLGWLRDGWEDVEFMISTNPGEGPRPVTRVASGGELSRITLAIKGVLGKGRSADTVVFDEVDQGISGPTAAMVGDKIRELSSSQQVICITHLPQIASLPGTHLLVSKVTDLDATLTLIRPLSLDERVKEVARLISGTEITKASLLKAEEMLGYKVS